MLVAVKPRLRNSCSGSIGSGARSSQAAKPATSRGADDDGGKHGRTGPAVVVPAHHAEHDPEQPQAGQGHAGQVQAGRRAVALAEPRPRDREERQADRHVQPEDPLPGGALDHGAADERPDGDGETAHCSPCAEGEAAPGGRHGRRQQGQRQRDDDGGADPLEGPGGDQPADPRGEGGGGGPGREQAEAGHEHPAPAEPLAERGAGEQQHGEGEGVGIDGPLQTGERGMQVGTDRRQCGGHHQVVERPHEQGRRGDHKGPLDASSVSHCLAPERPSAWSSQSQSESCWVRGSCDTGGYGNGLERGGMVGSSPACLCTR